MLLRNFYALFFKSLMIISTCMVALALFSIIWAIVSKGLPYLNWDMISKIPDGGFYIGKGGGVLNAIVGSIYITLGATFIGLLVSIPAVLYLNIYARKGTWLSQTIRMAADVLFGIPSIVYGAFAFTLMIFFGIHTSLLAGIIAVSFLVIPIMVRTMDEVVRLAPDDLYNVIYSMGTTRLEASLVILRQSVSGILTAILLSFGRAIGDAASVMFTAGYTDNIPTSLEQPAATLPLAVFFQLSSPIEEVQGRAYASAFILTVIILIVSFASKYFSNQLSKFKI